MWCDMICYAMVWYDMIWHDMIWYYMIRYDMMRYDVSWFTMTWYGMICYDMIWHAMIYIYIYIERERGITRIVWTTCWWRVGLSKHMGRRRMSKHVRNVSVICIYIYVYTHTCFFVLHLCFCKLLHFRWCTDYTYITQKLRKQTKHVWFTLNFESNRNMPGPLSLHEYIYIYTAQYIPKHNRPFVMCIYT